MGEVTSSTKWWRERERSGKGNKMEEKTEWTLFNQDWKLTIAWNVFTVQLRLYGVPRKKIPFRRFPQNCEKRLLTLILLTWRIRWAPNNSSKCHMGFNSAFKGLTSSCLLERSFVHPSVRTEQHGSHWMDFHEIWYLCIFRKKTVVKTQVSLKYDKNNRYFSWNLIYIFNNISLCSSYNEKCFRQKLYRKSKHTLSK